MALLAGACVISPAGVVSGTGLAAAIATATMTPPTPPFTSENSLQQWCNLLAAAIVTHIVTNASVTVSVVAGIPVTTAGTAAAQTGATTAPGAGTGTVA